MVYGRILYNNIKQYTPKWYPTIPYSQTVKPTFKRGVQVISVFNDKPNTKYAWRLFAKIFQQNSWMWQVFVLSSSIFMYYLIYTPFVTAYKSNNQHRTYKAAIAKEKAHKNKLKQLEAAQEESS